MTTSPCANVGGAAGAYRIKTSSSVTPLTYTTYDRLGRATRTQTKSLTGAYSYTDTWYDTQGRVKKQSLPFYSGNAVYVTPTYDLRGRLINITRADGSSTATSYTVSGNDVIVTVTDHIDNADGSSAGNQVKRSTYNILGQLISTTDAHGTSDAATVSYEYDANGNPTQVTAPGGAITTMVYDAAGNRTQLTGPNVGTVTTTFNALGQVRTNTDAKNQVTTFGYDTLGRLTSRTNTNGESATWEWDTATNGDGLLASRSNAGFTETYSYNSDSKLDETVTNITAIGASSGTNFTTSYSYDSSGRPLAIDYPGGYSVTRVYNSHGYLTELKNDDDVLQTFSDADAFGNITSESYGNGVATTRTYDPETGRLTAIDTDKGSTVIQDHDYSWRSNGTLESRIANPNEGINTTRKETFAYDALNRLTQPRPLSTAVAPAPGT